MRSFACPAVSSRLVPSRPVSSRHARAPKSMHCAVFYTLKINYVYAMLKWNRKNTHTHAHTERERNIKNTKNYECSQCVLSKQWRRRAFVYFVVLLLLGPVSLPSCCCCPPCLQCRFPLCVCFLRPIRSVFLAGTTDIRFKKQAATRW